MSRSSAVDVGLVGLGLVGTALAERFLPHGFAVAGYDIDPTRQISGVRHVASVREAAACPRLVLSLPTTDIVGSVVTELGPAARPGLLIVDTTTGEPQRTAALGQRLAAQGVAYVDATIAGSSEQVRLGQAVVMAGGDAVAVLACRDLFAAFAREWFHVGPCGSGARVKLVVNLVLGLNRAALAEGLALASRCGLNLDETLRVLQAGAAYSRAMDAKGRKMIDGDFQPQAKLSQHLKDVRLILAEARRVGAKVPLSDVHRMLLEQVESAGLGEADNAAIIRAFEG